MTNGEMIQEVRKSIMANTGYKFNEVKLASIIEAGMIPEGVFFRGEGYELVKEGSVVKCVIPGQGDQVQNLDNREVFEAMLMVYAEANC